MIEYEGECEQRIRHFFSVFGYAIAIGELERLDDDTRYIIETAALVHDIGIKASLEKFGDASGVNQEREGPAIARPMLEALGCDKHTIDRVCDLIACHHTYSGIEGIDYQVLIESDFLVNFGGMSVADRIEGKKLFRTETGKKLADTIYPTETAKDPLHKTSHIISLERKTMVELRKIDRTNFEDCIRLKVADSQQNFVASNIYSLAQAWLHHETAYPFAIYADGEIVGFVMMGYDPDNNSYIVWRFMIDARYQNKGYGKAALQLSIDFLRDRFDVKEIFLSFAPGNDVAEKMYSGAGFRRTGELDGDEIVMRLEIAKI
jgi:RimJ/RimL family protein N-acetyltransferase